MAGLVVAVRNDGLKGSLELPEGPGRLGCEPEGEALGAVLKVLEAAKRDGKRGNRLERGFEVRHEALEGLNRPERIDERDVGHPPADLTVVAAPDSLDGREDLLRRDQDDRAVVRRGHHRAVRRRPDGHSRDAAHGTTPRAIQRQPV